MGAPLRVGLAPLERQENNVRKTTARELAADLVFNVVLVLTAEAVVRLTHGSRLYVLTIVFIAGYSLRAVVQFWLNRRPRRNEELPPERAETSGRAPAS